MNENEFAAEVAELVGIRNDYEIPIIEEVSRRSKLRDGKLKSMDTLNQAAASNAPEG